METLKRKYYPDDSKDGTLIFYNWLRQYAKNDFTVLNVGAGPTADRNVSSLRGKVKLVIGCDVDKVVLENKDLDQAFVIKNNKFLFTDSYYDLA